METAMDIQAEQGTTGQNETNNKMETTIMKVQNNIQGIIQSKTQILAGVVVGGMMALAFLLPGAASADNPERPLSQVESSVFVPASTTANAIDMDFLEPGFYDAKLVSTNIGSAFDIDLLDPGFYDAKLAPASTVWESDGVDPYEDVAAKSVIRNTARGFDMDLLDPGFYDSKLIGTNTGSTFDMDLLDPGFYDAKLARTSTVWESDGVDPYEDVPPKSVIKHAAHGFDMDLLDPGIYDSKLISTNTGSAFDMDLLDPGIYDAKLGRTSPVWESDGVDPYEDMPAKSVRKSSAMDMDLLDPGFYNVVKASTDLEGLRQDNII